MQPRLIFEISPTRCWLMLLGFVYLFVFPVLFMIATSVKSDNERRNPLIQWISRDTTVDTYVLTYNALG